MTGLNRMAAVAGTAAVLVGLLPTAAIADDLTDLLNRANESTYSANRLVVSVWGGQTEIVKSFVEHSDGSEIVRVDQSWSFVGNGKAASMGETPAGVAFMSHSSPITTGRYSVGETFQAEHMRRKCTVVTVMEGDVKRASLVIDNNTGAPLITEMYDEDGSVFRRTSLQEFKAYRTYSWPTDKGQATYEIVMPLQTDLLPDEVAGYRLVEEFPAPSNSAQGFYSDGLYTFSLFVLDKGTPVTGFEEPSAFTTETGSYNMVPTADDIRMNWTGFDNEYVLVGDLPPDHAADVLAELPEPDLRSTLARWWSNLFG
jgi:hypothetical protein